ncbi:preprotein translocase subunit YajC [Kozakia baliensis]|uniref:Sec translocon accessory complex subunit YajC n=1 Tax=Kozakia baliensis TaxID=153496 RepID=A0A1D8URP1_9PROT|nr:preprotein translocase subunit YajC [Kozakia baliensis]AOX16304.1 preprotein translocase subunit YajC [Kozakia baliensis]GBR28536.1 protein translocase subunit YajC [Kozakia baliensis NRIC 0488]GEL63639.1 preprotein translocase subunit YajC [Kozakia baliensis]
MLANSGIIQFAPMILVFIVFYFMLIRPQQTRQRELKAQLAALRRGDRVLTSGGIIGTVQLAREGSPEVEVEIAPGIRVQIMRSNVSEILSSSAKPANDVKTKK